MATEPDQSAARRILLGHLVRTLGALPAAASLSLRHPRLPRARLHGGVTLGVDDDTEVFDIPYWIVGVTAAHLDAVARAWDGFGWATRRAPRPTTGAAYARTPDGCGLAVQSAVTGDLSLAGTTAPFPTGSLAGQRMPDHIAHPARPDRPAT
ncbi:hypothetical protein [Actinocatenispora rupis]|uniref:Uncharacterized protein n=1 Tax=Actinocatenispora rupis TaxID=519421 RepID=A0A8J3NH01_9ACTN|nr:hypothetical protein [Actinocatenispora rupis]GID15434.1 hypothetical protein Aru02nite_63230 [Actinocatenispora rupis]